MTSDFYGVTPQTVLGSDLERALEELSIRGFTVMENVVAPSDLPELRNRLDRVYETQRSELGADFSLEEIQEENQVRAPLCYDDRFLELATLARPLEAVRTVLGRYFVIQQQIGIINQPNTENRQAVWHRDLLYHDFVISRPLAVSVMVCLDDFSVETGGTVAVPFTHRVERMPSNEYIAKHAVTIEARAGSIFLQDSMLIHKAGYNSSRGPRRGINTIYVSGLLKQQINLPSQLRGKHADDPFLNMLLGYDAEPSASVLDWRKRRHRKQAKPR